MPEHAPRRQHVKFHGKVPKYVVSVSIYSYSERPIVFIDTNIIIGQHQGILVNMIASSCCSNAECEAAISSSNALNKSASKFCSHILLG